MARKRKPVKKQRRRAKKPLYVDLDYLGCCVPRLERPAAGLFSHVRCTQHNPHGDWTQPPKATWPSLLPAPELTQEAERAYWLDTRLDTNPL